MFIEYVYGRWKKEITDLLRKRILLKHKINYHERKVIRLKTDLSLTETELDTFLKKAGNKI